MLPTSHHIKPNLWFVANQHLSLPLCRVSQCCGKPGKETWQSPLWPALYLENRRRREQWRSTSRKKSSSAKLSWCVKRFVLLPILTKPSPARRYKVCVVVVFLNGQKRQDVPLCMKVLDDRELQKADASWGELDETKAQRI